MAGSQRRVRGDRSFRKILRRLPETMKAEMLELMNEAGDDLLSAMKAEVPARTGALRGALSKKLLKGTMRLRVGLIGKGTARRFFYGRIVEFGRKAQTVRVTRGGRNYSMRVPAMKARPYVYSRRSSLREAINKRVNTFWNGALAKAAQGAGDD